MQASFLKKIKKAVHFVSLHFSVWKKDSSRAKWNNVKCTA